MSIQIKLTLIMALMLSITLGAGGWVFVQSLDAVFEDKVAQETNHDIKIINAYLGKKIDALADISQRISQDDEVRALLNLVSNYQNPENYDPLLFDFDKAQILKRFDIWSSANYSIRLLSSNGELIAQKNYFSNQSPQGYITYRADGQAILVSGNQRLLFHKRGKIPQTDANYSLAFSNHYGIFRALKVAQIGYVEVGYWFGREDIKSLKEQLLHGVEFHTPQNLFSASTLHVTPAEPSRMFEKEIYNNGTPLLARLFIDTSFVDNKKSQVVALLLAGGILMALFSYGVFWFFIKYIVLNPLQRLKVAMESIRSNEYQKEKLKVANDEFGKILIYFDEVFEQLSQNYAFLESYRKAVDASVMVDQTDLEGKIIFVNSQFCQVLGYKEEELLGKTHEIIRHPENPPEIWQTMWDSLRQGNLWRGVIKNRCKDGRTIWVDMVISPLFDKDGNIKGYMSIKKDITSLKKMQEKLQKAKKAAEEANEAKSNFLANMSHEIRTPMNAIIGLGELLEDTNPTDEQKEMLSKMQNASRLLLNIINDILDFSKIEAGHLRLEQIPVRPIQLVRNMEALFGDKAKSKGVEFECITDSSVPFEVATDGFRLEQVLANIISNGIKFTHKGKVRLHVSLYQKISQDEVVLCFTIEDSGIGMSDEQCEMLFTPFMQADVSTTREYGGTGLGMAISQRILEAMNSKLEVISKENKGSTFWFYLPLHVKSWTDTNQEKTTVLKPSKILKGIRVLIVEDNEINQSIVERMLQKEGMICQIAHNGKEALGIIESGVEFDIVLMDIQMPIMGGYEATRLIRQNHQKLPIIALTAAATVEDKQKALESGMNDHLGKPVETFKLYEKIAFWVDN
jgi:PAS domain S-box-containing protein